VIAFTVLLSVFAHGVSAAPLSKLYGDWARRTHAPIENEPSSNRCPRGDVQGSDGQVSGPPTGQDVRMDVEIVRNPAASRFELLLNGERIGEMEYIKSDGVLTLTHTRCGPGVQRTGSRGAWSRPDCRTSRRTVNMCCRSVPTCADTSSSTRSGCDLVPADRRDEFGLT
jgi:hypothetical protein